MEYQAITSRSELEGMLLDDSAEPKCLPLSLLEDITNNFCDDNRIGSGGFAVVYKGMLCNCMVAVKKLSERVDIDEDKFSEEIHCLMKTKHRNIVRFLGYCSVAQGEMLPYKEKLVLADRRQRLLCFVYLPKGSLDNQITDASCGLEWRERFQIINGICDGLNYLRQKSIIHLDLKPQNILLDDNMVPKIADFGISRFFNGNQSGVTTSNVVGTLGYLAPEFFGRRKITFKLDIYSLGIIIIEILTGEKGHPDNIDNVLDTWRSRMEKSHGDKQLEQVRVCIDIAIECTDFNPEKRPDIQLIIDRLGETKGGDESTAETGASVIWESISSTDVEETLIIGRNEEKQKIIATLSGSITPEFTVLPIYGIGGIGKTTLAELIFNDSQFAGYSRVWVYVSQNLDLNRIGNSIISQLSKVSHVADKKMIHYHLTKLLAGKKILIVLDDVWEKNPDALKTLKTMLRLGVDSMMTIIVTTRDEEIAIRICHTVEPYKLESLTSKMCWTIIKQKSAFKDRVDKKQLKHIGWGIATRCGGVALAAQSLGYTLNGKTSDEWESMRDNYMWNLSTPEDPSSINQEVLASLLLSYSHMPEWLKLCFSYCAVFPKGHNIVKYDLIHQWIALGFTELSRIFDPMQLCEKYITYLLGMSFIQYSKIPSTDELHDKYVTLFKMHDLVHDLARAILSEQVNNKGSAVGNRCRYALLTDCSTPLQLSVSSTEDSYFKLFLNSLQKKSSPKNLKVIHFIGCGKLELCGHAFSPAECLLVLDLSECFIRKLPDSVGQLKHLRFLHAPRIQDHMIPDCISRLSELNYLSLRGSCNISALPESIGSMKRLMHLDLSGCHGISDLPVSFAELKQLVHLDFSHCKMSISEAFGVFTQLQYLNLSIQAAIGMNRRGLSKVIGNLIKLRYLNLSRCMEFMVSSKDQISSLLESISTLSNLEHLDLSKNVELTSLPESIGNLVKLHTLDLSGCLFICKLPESMVYMVSLKVLNVDRWVTLDDSVLSQFSFASLPRFVVHPSSDKHRSNIILLEPTNPVVLSIDRLENVKSTEEAESIQLIKKQKIEDLRLQWTLYAARFVDDKEVLEKLVPPRSLKKLCITGYRGVSTPNWLMGIRQYLPNLVAIDLCDFPNCNNLPPLGQLPNLKFMSLCRMESLEEWDLAYTSVEQGVNELRFPRLEVLRIELCAKLRIKPCLPRVMSLHIVDCDNVLSSFEESWSHSGASSSSPVTNLSVGNSKLPLHGWRLLHQLPALHSLEITRCSDLTASPDIIQQLSSLQSLSLWELGHDQVELPTWVVELKSLQSLELYECKSMTSLPQWLGELTTLQQLKIMECQGISNLPESIQQLTNLEHLIIRGCPTLWMWCRSEENMMKLTHIRQKHISYAG